MDVPEVPKWTKRLAVKIAKFFIHMTMKVKWLILALFVTRFAAVVIYQPIEDWSMIDAWWWTDAASQTIGYGDEAPATDLGRLLAAPFHYFWVYYTAPALVAHVVAYVWKNKNEFTHNEQEWLFNTIGRIFEWVRWLVHAVQKIAEERGIVLDPPPNVTSDGSLETLADQAPDTDDGNLNLPYPAK